jgi:hypothetical protein
LTNPINALELNPEVILNKRDTAPWRGVLVPEYQYKKLQADSIEREMLLNQLNSCEEWKAENSQPSFDVSAALVTFLAGGLTGYLALELLKR